AAFNASIAGNESIAVVLLLLHAEISAAMRDQLIGFFKCAFIEQELDAFTRRHLALLVLARAPLRASTLLRQLVATLQFRNFFFEIHGLISPPRRRDAETPTSSASTNEYGGGGTGTFQNFSNRR